MKNKKFIFMGIVLIAIVVVILLFNPNKSSEYKVDKSDIIQKNSLIENIEISSVDENEINGLILMREEEKLARDTYLTLYDKWGLKIFKNIANSEQTHTNAVKDLLERYNIDDPVLDDEIGNFNSSELKKIYDDLVNTGSGSLLDALKVGALVEDLDIKDLSNLIEQTNNEDITVTYQNLMKGSRNHLRAFTNQINRNGGEYSPEYISLEEYDSIISSSQERGRII